MSPRLAVPFIFLAAVIACDPGPAKPVDPAWNKQACAHCMMLLSDKHSAGQLVTPSGERLFFDDVGCLVSWLDAEHPQTRRAWVRTPDGLGWLTTSSAERGLSG